METITDEQATELIHYVIDGFLEKHPYLSGKNLRNKYKIDPFSTLIVPFAN